jgi:hypothetical protein
MNETPPVNELLADPVSAESRNKIEKSLSDRILGYAFVASLVVNIGWIALVSHSNLFGGGSVLPILHEKPIKVFKPIPIKHHIKPPKPPPPPPKPPKIPPKIKPLQQHPRPTPPRPRPTPAPVSHSVSVHTTTNTRTTSTVSAPPSPPSNSAAPFVPSASPPTPPTPPAPPVVAPPVVAPPVVAPPVVAPPVVAPPPPQKPKPPPDRDEPELRSGSFDDITLSIPAGSSVNVSQVTATWSVNAEGRPISSSIRLDPKTSGDSDVDDQLYAQIEKFRFLPARHNGVAESSQVSHTFTISQ